MQFKQHGNVLNAYINILMYLYNFFILSFLYMYFTGCRTSAHNFIRKIMALPFLPEAEIQPIFQRLQLEATGQLLQFTQYVSSMWIHGTTWSPVDWTVFRHAISYAPTAILRGGTMASITEPLDVASCRCTFLSSSFTERLC